MKQTLGLRNNNPLNIRYSPMNKWQGQTGCNRGFCTFTSMEYGWRAALVLMRNYVRRGLNTPRLIITHWAPSNENDTEAYIRNAPYTYAFDANHRISTIADLAILCYAMAVIESRVCPSQLAPLDLIEIANKYNIKL